MTDMTQGASVVPTPTGAGPRQRPVPLSSRAAWAAGAAVMLVIAADLLFYSQRAGLNFSLFGLLVAACIVLVWHQRAARPLTLAALGLAVVTLIPSLETPSPVGLLLMAGGLSVLALAITAKLPSSPVGLPAVLMRFGIVAPVAPLMDSYRFIQTASRKGFARSAVASIAVWLVPVGLALVFLLLFSAANPVIESVLRRISLTGVLRLLDADRIIYWCIVLWLVWPLLLPRLLRVRRVAAGTGPEVRGVRSGGLLFGHSAILRSLIVFNALFAVQTGLDIAYLWAGQALPDSMTYADYAHRGAYPLVVTALLAACFVLVAMRRNGEGQRSPVIRRLVYLWIAQNVLLVISSILRLDLYVETYSLTELRIAAGVWMGLVATGLVLICARIALNQTNAWLIASNAAVLAVTLYASSFIDYGWFIARYNVEHSFEMTGRGTQLDLEYLQSLGPHTIPALDDFTPADDLRRAEAENLRHALAWSFINRNHDVRGWSFSDWRLDRYLEQDGLVEREVALPSRLSMD